MELEHVSYRDWYDECLNILIPEYLGDLTRKYNLRYKPVSVTEIAMYNEHCCLILGLDKRDGVILTSDVNENGKRVEYSTNIFFRVSIDDSDKEGVDLNAHNFIEKARRDLKILSRNLDSKWSKYLQGDRVRQARRLRSMRALPRNIPRLPRLLQLLRDARMTSELQDLRRCRTC